MLKNYLYTILIFILFISFSCVKKKVARYGCKDLEATNFDPAADFDNGGCVYKSLITDPNFENDQWYTYTGSGFSWNAIPSSINDGYMPTSGKYYLKCIPYVNTPNGTSTKQYLKANKHCKGFYFDYSYIAIAGLDSILKASIRISYFFSVPSQVLWTKSIDETPLSYSGFPIILVQKKNEYVELPYSESDGELFIKTEVSKGTFTFCIDNIREVPR
jgi:hypothetical protein